MELALTIRAQERVEAQETVLQIEQQDLHENLQHVQDVLEKEMQEPEEVEIQDKSLIWWHKILCHQIKFDNKRII